MTTYRDGTTHNALTGGTWQLDARRVWVWVPYRPATAKGK